MDYILDYFNAKGTRLDQVKIDVLPYSTPNIFEKSMSTRLYLYQL